jgi:hypothetical protein
MFLKIHFRTFDFFCCALAWKGMIAAMSRACRHKIACITKCSATRKPFIPMRGGMAFRIKGFFRTETNLFGSSGF